MCGNSILFGCGCRKSFFSYGEDANGKWRESGGIREYFNYNNNRWEKLIA